MYLPMLSDRELLNHANQTLHSLTSSDLERELIKRLEAQADAEDDYAPLKEAIDEGGVELSDLPAIIKLLDEFSAAEPAALRQKLERADTFYDIAQEAGDTIKRLSDLAEKTA